MIHVGSCSPFVRYVTLRFRGFRGAGPGSPFARGAAGSRRLRGMIVLWQNQVKESATALQEKLETLIICKSRQIHLKVTTQRWEEFLYTRIYASYAWKVMVEGAFY